ncbi:MAG: rhomboid family intramembrane serine protease [Lachnospiraceae bacterium]|nr:rhomboid family intramembrane serine protease [Lachnospiraceae bacterium]
MNQRYVQALVQYGYAPEFPDKPNMLVRKQGNECYIVMMGNYVSSTEDIILRREELTRFYHEQGYLYVYHLLVLFHRDAMFLEEQLEQVERIRNVWLFAEDQNRVFQYENQPIDFDGLCQVLESVPSGQHASANGFLDRSKRLIGNGYFSRATFPYVTVTLALLNILCYFIPILTGYNETVLTMGALWGPGIIERGEWYRLLSSMFLHADFRHISNNMISLLLLGNVLEPMIGKWKYLCLYIVSGIAGGLLSLLTGGFYDNTMSIGASGAIFGIMGGILISKIVMRDKLPGISLGWMIWMCISSIIDGFQTEGIDNAGHIGGFIGGLVMGGLFIWYQKCTNSGRKNE